MSAALLSGLLFVGVGIVIADESHAPEVLKGERSPPSFDLMVWLFVLAPLVMALILTVLLWFRARGMRVITALWCGLVSMFTGMVLGGSILFMSWNALVSAFLAVFLVHLGFIVVLFFNRDVKQLFSPAKAPQRDKH